MNNCLVIGSTGYLGKHIVSELQNRHLAFRALARNANRLGQFNLEPKQIITAEATDPSSIVGCCEGVDVVISSLGITKQTDGLSYMDVDFQANMNILEEAKKCGVKKFIYVSVLHGDVLKGVHVCDAKERFVEELKASGMDYCIVRPSGFFSDMGEIYELAKKGRVYLFGDGSQKANPIDGGDLAQVCIDVVSSDRKEIEVGGPETLTHKDIAEQAFAVLRKPVKITFIPNWIRKALLNLGSLFMGKSAFGKFQFFLTVMAIDMNTKAYGSKRLVQHFEELHRRGDV